MRKQLGFFSAVLACLVYLPGGILSAQNVTGTISGVVRDASGAVVPGAEIKVTHTGTRAGFAGLSGEDGTYAIRALPVGVYDLIAEVQGFKKYETKAIRLQVNEVARVDVNLAVGETTETVTVSGQVVTVDTTTATLKGVVDQKRIAELPLNGRNPTQLMRLIVGVTADPRADVTSGTTYPGVVPVSVNGGRANTTNYVLDGSQNNDHYSNAPNPMPNPDALQEFSVQTNNFSAEFGRQSGGVVNAVTKSGSNEIHGSAFEFLRNKAVNAANFFSPIVNGKKRDDGLKRNQFGATLGGPVFFPKLYNGKDKSFFFFSYQGTLERRAPNVVQRIVPTEAQRRGDFSALPRQLRDPFRGGVYPGNRIPASDINPVSRTILENFLPVPPGGGNAIFTAARQDFDDNQYLVRLDHQISQSNRLSGRYWDSRASTPAFLNPGNYLESTTGRTWQNTSVTLTDTHIFSPNVTNQVLFGFNRTDGNNRPITPPKSLTDLGVKMFNDKNPQYHITVVGYFGTLNTGDTNQFLRDEYQLSDTLRWSKGRHQITLGGEYGRGIGDIVNNFRANGQFNFNGAAPFTGDSLADFMVGKFNSLTQGIGEFKKTRFTMVNFFFQDSMKLRRNFTLDLGMRWEPFFPFTDVDGKLATWRAGRRSERYVNAPPGVLYPGDPDIPDGGFPTTWANFGPRLGFAWDVFGDGQTSVRGGYGIFFDRSNTISTNSQANQAPFGTVVSTFGNATNSFLDPYAGTVNPFPASTTPPRDVAFPAFSTHFLYEEHMRNPYIQSWNLTLEREFAGGFVGRASYAASKGTRLVALRELNPAVFAPGATTATTNQRRALAPALGQTTIIEPVSNSTFHSLQLTAERRFDKGFTILANYMWAKSMDDASANKATGQGRTNPNSQAFDKGPSDFDKRHVFNFSSLWELPFRSEHRGLNLLFGGWELSSIVSLWSGYPFSVGSGVDNARTGTGSQRADLVSNPFLASDRSRGDRIAQWLNRAAFAPNALGTFGNQGRNMWRGPGFATADLGLSKSFRAAERFTTTFRFEVFNAFNRVNLAGPNAAQNNVNFMRTTSAFDPRILQFALRLDW